MNAVRGISPNVGINEIKSKQSKISLVSIEIKKERREVDKMTKEYINEKLYYFYNNGGPIMDI
jgi:formate-dependent nitrite reductase cytochrome c552 subunit